MLRVGVVGCGAIGHVIAESIDKRLVDAELVALNDRDPSEAQSLADTLSQEPRVLDLDGLIEESDLVVESAAQEAVPQIAIPSLEQGRDVMIMSTGALADDDLRARLLALARENRSRIIIPSGAIAGTDGLRAASVKHVSHVKLTTSKPPMSLEGVEYLEEKGVDVSSIKERTTVYEGPASEATQLFPANVNVAATIGLAGPGLDKTTVQIVADPRLNKNVHEVEARGDFGRMHVRVENVQSPDNPKTSYLAALAAVSALRRYVDPLQIG